MSIDNPYTSCHFLVEINAILVAGFSEVSGLGVRTELDVIREGGVNNQVYNLPKQTTASQLVLKKGLSLEPSFLWAWYASAVEGNVTRHNGSLFLLDQQLLPSNKWWNFYNAFPIEWRGPEFNAMNSAIAIESFTLSLDQLELGGV